MINLRDIESGTYLRRLIVHHSSEAAHAVLKGQSAVPAALSMRIEDVAAGLAEQMAQLAADQAACFTRISADQNDRLARIERQARRSRWRRQAPAQVVTMDIRAELEQSVQASQPSQATEGRVTPTRPFLLPGSTDDLLEAVPGAPSPAH